MSRYLRAMSMVLHGLGAAAWWQLLPHGFVPSNPHFWVNEVVPWLVLVAVAVSMIRQTRWLTALLAAAWLGGAGVFALIFDGPAWLIGFAVACGLAQAVSSWERHGSTAVAALLGVVTGGALVAAQRAPAPSTKPLGHALETLVGADSRPVIEVEHARVYVENHGVKLMVDPLLQFYSRAPDRGWVLWANDVMRDVPPPRLLEQHTNGGTVEATYSASDVQQRLRVSASDGGVQLEAWSTLTQPISAHLDTFLTFDIDGLKVPRLRFAACGDAGVDVVASDYPIGRPTRFATLRADGQLAVLEATSAEKGPFHTLASGRIGAEPLLIDVLDGDAVQFSLEVWGWASQASVDASPTAGWGVPQNAIEFSRASDEPGARVALYFTLASTSVGRGFDSVMHAPGLYWAGVRISAREPK